MYCYVCVIYLIIIATAHPPKDREVSKSIEKRSIFRDVIESLKMRNQLPEDMNIEEDNNVGENYDSEDEPLHLPSDLAFLPRRNDRIEMPSLKYRFPKNLKINHTDSDDKYKKTIVLYVSATSTPAPKPKPPKTPKPKPTPPVNKTKPSNKNNSNEEDRPFFNSMTGLSQIGNREYQTIVKPTVIINLQGSISNLERDIVSEKRILENETSIPSNIFNINQEIELDLQDPKLDKTAINDKPSATSPDDGDKGRTHIEEDMMMCETSSNNKDTENSKHKYDIVNLKLVIN